MKLGRKFVELLLLVATLAVVANLSMTRSLNVDGVSIGMSYRDVLKIHGPPDSLEWEDGKTCFVYPNERSYWFSEGCVVFASGRRLMEGERVVYKAGEPAEILTRALGTAEEITYYDGWFPDFGVVVSNYALENKAYGHSHRVGLRTLDPPPDWQLVPGSDAAGVESRWSRSEPWSDAYHENWYIGPLRLGMSEEEAAGLQQEADVILDGGFVRGVREPRQACLFRAVSSHMMPVGVEVGRRLNADIYDFNPDWERKLSPHPNAEITYDGEIVTKIDLYVKDDELFEALREL